MTNPLETKLARDAGIEVPILCGAMYPCSNPELIAAVSEAGAMGIVQPLSLIHVHGHDLREGLRLIRGMTTRPIGFNAIVEKSVKAYEQRMRAWVAIALEEGVRFFVTALGNPDWVVEAVHEAGGLVYHDVTERRWAEKALASGVDGLICVNGRAGGHAGTQTPEDLYADLCELGVPLVRAGGVGSPADFKQALATGYAGVQMGTRFIATPECKVHETYRAAIVKAREEDIILTERLSGVPVSVIKTPLIERLGADVGPLARRLLRGRKTRHWMRTFYALRSLRRLKRSSLKGLSYGDVFQAGRSVEGIDAVLPAGEIVRSFAAAASAED
ncbi:MAG: nitronate monooxygenase [Planctomycetota bacterium]|jgi:nitronate monooxygenase|nr:2-nitropropane dioxygenase [Planctomycetota bacterium]MDP6837544.1 nitronate monooxygenase [Planctomycetota bacterium]